MTRLSTRSLESVEKKMADLDQNSIRYQILKSVKDFKTSWIELGQALYTVWKDKLYKEWGYMTFDAYTAKEIGIRKPTAIKLLKSYYFLEKEAPSYINKDYSQTLEAANLPNYEAVNALRLAKDKKVLTDKDYAHFKKEVLEEGKDVSAVKKDLTSMIRQREELDPDEARERRRTVTLKRLLSTLKTLKQELEASKLVSQAVIKDISSLVNKIEGEIDS